MVVRRRLRCVLATLALLVGAGPAASSGPSPTAPWYLDQYGGAPTDVAAKYDGRIGIVMAAAPRPLLFVDWRLLHGRPVGRPAGEALATPCCGAPWWEQDYTKGAAAWRKARALVTGREDTGYLATERPGPDGISVPNCFPDAFDTAAATLRDRVGRHGAGDAAVRAWLQAQDAVFAACHDPRTRLLPAPADAPPWLRMDRDYQEAALALYAGRDAEASDRFEAIGRDGRSPWRGWGPYLAARAALRQATDEATPAAYAHAHRVLAELAAAPSDAPGRGRAAGLGDALAFRERPRAFLAELGRRLDAPHIGPDAATAFRDYVDLGEAATSKPEALDWMDTLRAQPDPAAPTKDGGPEPAEAATARYDVARRAALAHAVARWRGGSDRAWLVAALSLADRGDADAPTLLRAATLVRPGEAAWLSVQHHLVRLTIDRAPAADTRRRLDAVLRRPLSASDRSVFSAERAQVAADLPDFVRFALRRRLCVGADRIDWEHRSAPACTRWRWGFGEVQPSGVYDGEGARGAVGLGEDARAAIDRAPLEVRLALARDVRLPAKIRLDVALTSYARAVQLQDDAAVDAAARPLVALLPLMAEPFRGVLRARPGADKRFAEFLVLAMIPGVRVDLADYVRPEGRRVEDYQAHWMDWLILGRPERDAGPPALAAYQDTGTGFARDITGPWPDAASDLSCLGECGRGAAPLATPRFLRDAAGRAARERGFLHKVDVAYGRPPPVDPPGAVDAWDEMLAYAGAHPADLRVPEALHWLVHVGHFGGGHRRSGYRAYRLLHARYPGSYWARRTPYYND